jgi:geranylgeranyl pyrophosphate synthase
MDIYSAVISKLSEVPDIQEWPEMQAILYNAAAQEPSYWRLPMLSCTAVGGDEDQALPAVAAIACMQISIILVDDMLDSDPRGDYRKFGAPAAANLAVAFQAAGIRIIERCPAKPPIKLAVIDCLSQMMLTTALGQQLDTQNPDDEASYWRLIKAKSSPFFSTALHVGALLGGASKEMSEKIRAFGSIYGEIIQIHDDLNDTMAVPANPDWINGRSPLPILYAQVVDHPARARFLELRQAVQDVNVLREAQGILIRCGAVSYCVDQILRKHESALAILNSISLAHREGLDDLLNSVVVPVYKLFSAASQR